jgi:hypothetical protein
MITVRLNAMAIRDLAGLCRAKAKRVTQDRSYWLNLASTLDDAITASWLPKAGDREPFAEGESRQDDATICDKYCGRADCYVGSGDDIGPEKFRCMKSTAPARIIQ